MLYKSRIGTTTYVFILALFCLIFTYTVYFNGEFLQLFWSFKKDLQGGVRCNALVSVSIDYFSDFRKAVKQKISEKIEERTSPADLSVFIEESRQ